MFLASSFATITINGQEVIGLAENISIQLIQQVSDVAYGIGTANTANTLFQRPISYECSFDTYSLLDIEGNSNDFNPQDINADSSSQIIINQNKPIVNATDNARQFDGKTIILSGVGVKDFTITTSLNNAIINSFSFVALSLVMT